MEDQSQEREQLQPSGASGDLDPKRAPSKLSKKSKTSQNVTSESLSGRNNQFEPQNEDLPTKRVKKVDKKAPLKSPNRVRFRPDEQLQQKEDQDSQLEQASINPPTVTIQNTTKRKMSIKQRKGSSVKTKAKADVELQYQLQLLEENDKSRKRDSSERSAERAGAGSRTQSSMSEYKNEQMYKSMPKPKKFYQVDDQGVVRDQYGNPIERNALITQGERDELEAIRIEKQKRDNGASPTFNQIEYELQLQNPPKPATAQAEPDQQQKEDAVQSKKQSEEIINKSQKSSGVANQTKQAEEIINESYQSGQGIIDKSNLSGVEMITQNKQVEELMNQSYKSGEEMINQSKEQMEQLIKNTMSATPNKSKNTKSRKNSDISGSQVGRSKKSMKKAADSSERDGKKKSPSPMLTPRSRRSTIKSFVPTSQDGNQDNNRRKSTIKSIVPTSQDGTLDNKSKKGNVARQDTKKSRNGIMKKTSSINKSKERKDSIVDSFDSQPSKSKSKSRKSMKANEKSILTKSQINEIERIDSKTQISQNEDPLNFSPVSPFRTEMNQLNEIKLEPTPEVHASEGVSNAKSGEKSAQGSKELSKQASLVKSLEGSRQSSKQQSSKEQVAETVQAIPTPKSVSNKSRKSTIKSKKSSKEARGAQASVDSKEEKESGKKSGKSGSRKRRRTISRELQERLSGEYDKERQLCSQEHNPEQEEGQGGRSSVLSERQTIQSNSQKWVQNKDGHPINNEVVANSQQQQLELQMRGRQSISNDDIMAKQVGPPGDSKVQYVSQVLKEVKDMGCNPIEFTPPQIKEKEEKKEVAVTHTQTEEYLSVNSPKHNRTARSISPYRNQIDEDWYHSGLYELVQKINSLPIKNKNAKVKQLEKQFCDPLKLDLFTEEEAKYNATLLKKRCERGGEGEIVNKGDQGILEELYKKARRTVEKLSEHLLLSVNQFEDEGLDTTLDGNMSSPSIKTYKTSVILINNTYSKVDLASTMKLLLRCKKLYVAMFEVKKILQMILKQEEMFHETEGLLYKIVIKYEREDDRELTDQDESAILKGIQLLQKVSRRIVQFQQDNKLFKSFKFNKNEHQNTLLNHAHRLSKVLRDKNSTYFGTQYPTLDNEGLLIFVDTEINSDGDVVVKQSTQMDEEEMSPLRSDMLDSTGRKSGKKLQQRLNDASDSFRNSRQTRGEFAQERAQAALSRDSRRSLEKAKQKEPEYQDQNIQTDYSNVRLNKDGGSQTIIPAALELQNLTPMHIENMAHMSKEDQAKIIQAQQQQAQQQVQHQAQQAQQTGGDEMAAKVNQTKETKATKQPKETKESQKQKVKKQKAPEIQKSPTELAAEDSSHKGQQNTDLMDVNVPMPQQKLPQASQGQVRSGVSQQLSQEQSYEEISGISQPQLEEQINARNKESTAQQMVALPSDEQHIFKNPRAPGDMFPIISQFDEKIYSQKQLPRYTINQLNQDSSMGLTFSDSKESLNTQNLIPGSSAGAIINQKIQQQSKATFQVGVEQRIPMEQIIPENLNTNSEMSQQQRDKSEMSQHQQQATSEQGSQQLIQVHDAMYESKYTGKKDEAKVTEWERIGYQVRKDSVGRRSTEQAEDEAGIIPETQSQIDRRNLILEKRASQVQSPHFPAESGRASRTSLPEIPQAHPYTYNSEVGHTRKSSNVEDNKSRIQESVKESVDRESFVSQTTRLNVEGTRHNIDQHQAMLKQLHQQRNSISQAGLNQTREQYPRAALQQMASVTKIEMGSQNLEQNSEDKLSEMNKGKLLAFTNVDRSNETSSRAMIGAHAYSHEMMKQLSASESSERAMQAQSQRLRVVQTSEMDKQDEDQISRSTVRQGHHLVQERRGGFPIAARDSPNTDDDQLSFQTTRVREQNTTKLPPIQ